MIHVLKILALARTKKQKVVLVTGVFDLLHQEHVLFLQKAKAVGDVLLIGVESDKRVARMKGEGRPIHPVAERIAALTALQLADGTFSLPEKFDAPDDFDAFMALIRPDVLAVSSHTLHQEAKRALVEKYGGVLQVVHQHNPEVSTSIILGYSNIPSST